MDGPRALDALEQAWGDAYDIGCDDQTWWYRRKDGIGHTHTATSSAELHQMIADDHAFFPLRRAS
ncbi:MAG TPA: hypothetical protein VN969_09185 [Streptosporangiaceae bacterium]|nr:hypothetical protein [Streptosporangiaceae bacterium]